MRPIRRAPGQLGASLVEALTALAVFSLGVLGTFALHAHAMRHVGEAQHRAEAVRLAHSLLGSMWAEDPAGLAARYDARDNGDGYTAFARLAGRLPGSDGEGNAPEVRVEAGPTTASRSVTVGIRWQLPGDPIAHRYRTTAVIGRN